MLAVSLGLCGPVAWPTVLPGPGAQPALCQILTAQWGRAWLGVGGSLLGPRTPHRELLQATVRSLASCGPRPHLPHQGPAVPRPHVLVTWSRCRLRGAPSLG